MRIFRNFLQFFAFAEEMKYLENAKKLMYNLLQLSLAYPSSVNAFHLISKTSDDFRVYSKQLIELYQLRSMRMMENVILGCCGQTGPSWSVPLLTCYSPIDAITENHS